MRSPALLLISALLSNCDCGTLGLEDRHFACTSDDECLDGFLCRDVGRGRECVVATIDGGVGDGGVDAGANDAGLSDAGLDGGVNDGGASDGGLQFENVPRSSLAGACVPISLRAVSPATAALDVSLSVTPAAAARFSSQAGCSDTIQSVRFAQGASSASFFVKAISGGQTQLSASGALGAALATLETTPVVRRGVCSLPASRVLPDGGSDGIGLSKLCSFAPPVTDLGHSFLIIQPTASAPQLSGAAAITCRLSGNDSLTCLRAQDSDPITVYFQVAELLEGLRVVQGPRTDCGQPHRLDAGLDPSRTMLLRTSASVSNFFDDDDSPVITFEAPDQVKSAPLTCGILHTQLLEWTGVTVTQGLWDAGVDGFQADVTGLPATGPNTILSSQTQTPDAVNDACAVFLRPTLTSPTSLRITRGAGADGGCGLTPFPGLVFERIDFGSRANVQQLEVRTVAGVFTNPLPIRAVDVSRTLLMTSSQSVGQGSGETELADPRNYTPAMAAFNFTTSSQVQVLRGDLSRSSTFTVNVIELNP